MLSRFVTLVVIVTATSLPITLAGDARKEPSRAMHLLTNPARDLTVFSDREEKLVDYFRRQPLVIAGATAKDLTAQIEAREAGPEVFVNYASYNFGPGGKRSTFGAFIRIAPISKEVAKALENALKAKKASSVVFRAQIPEPADGARERPIWHVVGFTSRSSVQFFESNMKVGPEDLSQRDLLFREGKKGEEK